METTRADAFGTGGTILFAIGRLVVASTIVCVAYSYAYSKGKKIGIRVAVDGVIKATRIYDKILRESIRSLSISEPEMNGAMRKRMATKLAETACRTFLMETLNYSKTEANECIRNIQN